MEKTTGLDNAMPLLGEDWFDPLETGVRQQIRSFIEAMLEAELESYDLPDDYYPEAEIAEDYL